MNLNPKVGMPGKRTALVVVVLLAVLGGIGYFVHDFLNGEPKPWYARWQIKRYLKKQTGQSNFKSDFNFNLANDVAKLATNVVLLETNISGYLSNSTRMQKEIAALHRLITAEGELSRKQTVLSNRLRDLNALATKIPSELTNLPMETLTNTTLLQKESDTLKAVVDPVYAPLQPLRDEINALEKTVTEKQQATGPKRREITAIQKQLASGTRMDGTNEVKLTEADLPALTNQIAAIQAEIAPTQAEIAELNKQINAKQQEHSEKTKSVGAQLRLMRLLNYRLSELSAAETNVARLQVDITGIRQDVETRAKDAGVAPGTVAEHQKLVAEKQKELTALRQKHDAQLTELAAKRKDLYAQKNLLDAQQTNFSAQFKKKYDEAKSYGEMYRLLGQQLWVANELLVNPSPQQKRVGLVVASQSAFYCATIIENNWLAARISEGYVLPHLALADDNRAKAPLNPNNLLQQCIGYYSDAGETNGTIGTLKLSLKLANNQAAKDYAWYLLGREYQQSNAYADALAAFKSIQDTNNYRWAVRQIPWLESRIQAVKSKK